jgi:hypothetical protein
MLKRRPSAIANDSPTMDASPNAIFYAEQISYLSDIILPVLF